MLDTVTQADLSDQISDVINSSVSCTMIGQLLLDLEIKLVVSESELSLISENDKRGRGHQLTAVLLRQFPLFVSCH